MERWLELWAIVEENVDGADDLVSMLEADKISSLAIFENKYFASLAKKEYFKEKEFKLKRVQVRIVID